MFIYIHIYIPVKIIIQKYILSISNLLFGRILYGDIKILREKLVTC